MRSIKIGIDVGENEAEPRLFIECAVLADKLGFDSFWFGDHFMPWFHTGGKSAFIWSLMSVALELTSGITVGPDVTSPIGGRFHPAIIAQAAATLDNLYPGRFLLGVGSGEAVNEARFFEERDGRWPSWRERIERLVEAIHLMRRLWTSDEYFSFEGKYFKLRDVMLYTKPKTAIPIYFSAIGEKAAYYAGMYGDHLITLAPPSRCRDVIYPRFEEGYRASGRDPRLAEKMVLLNIVIGEPEEAIRKLKSGPAGYLARGAFDEPDPRRVEMLATTVDDSLISEYFAICRDVKDLINVIEQYRSVGTNHIVIGTGASPSLIRQIADGVLSQF
jgi:coenzyme F420-dependent glucose-6-phosphate dehydrogenase